MLNNKVVKDIQSLRDKKSRDAAGLFVAEGPKIVSELIQAAPRQVKAVYGLQPWMESNASLLHNISSAQIIDERILERISHLQTPNTVLALVKQFPASVPDATKDWCLFLDTIQDPGNMGTIIRLADWFAIPHIICTPGCADVYNSKVVQSTMASLARVNIWTDVDGTWLNGQNATLYAAALNGESIYNLAPATTGVLMIGNESKGLRPGFLEMATQKITIPKKGGAESLNAAVATGIILSHLTPRHSPPLPGP